MEISSFLLLPAVIHTKVAQLDSEAEEKVWEGKQSTSAFCMTIFLDLFQQLKNIIWFSSWTKGH